MKVEAVPLPGGMIDVRSRVDEAVAVMIAAGGFAAFAIASVSGLGGWEQVVRAGMAGVALGILPAVVTGPTLLVGQQVLDVAADESEVVGSLAAGIARAGRVAWGLVPVALFFAATSELAAVVALLGTAIVGSVGLAGACRGIFGALRAPIGGGGATPAAASARALVLTVGWAVLAFAVTIRVAFDAVRFVVEG